jgi:hypothetical protein
VVCAEWIADGKGLCECSVTNKIWWQNFRESRGRDLQAVAAITLFFLLCFWPLFLRGKFFVTSDAFIELYPLRTEVWNSIRHGQLPLWTPYILSGYPLLSMAQNGIGYPLTCQYLFLPGWWAEQIYVLAPFILFPCFTYAYAREIARSRMASFVAALTFGASGAMFNALAYNGLHPNALMWFPLVLIALERSRNGRFVPCLLGATGAYAMSVLSGYGQGFVICGIIALIYAIFLGMAARPLTDASLKWISWKRWQPLFIAVCAIVISAGLAAFQIFESLRAHKRSIRRTLTYDLLISNSFTLKHALQSFFTPLHHITDTTAYIAPVSFGLALIGAWATLRRKDARAIFWLATAVLGFVLMLGGDTPIYHLLYYVPVLNLFRAPARHAYELAFGIAILSAYGWDKALECHARIVNRNSRIFIISIPILLTLGVAIAALWSWDLSRTPIYILEWFYRPPLYPEYRYLLWKAPFVLVTIVLIWASWPLRSATHRNLLAAATICLACFIEPALFASRFWWPTLKPASRFNSESAATRYLQGFPAEQNRIYTRTNLWWEERSPQPRLPTANLNLLHGLQNVAGYEPLIFERYSRALGNVFLDAVYPRPGYEPDTSILESKSHVLDLLNTRFMVAYFDLATEPYTPAERDGIKFSDRDLIINLRPAETASLDGVAAESDALAIASTLSFSADVADGEVVAKVRLITEDGRVVEREILAGRDTAEWAHERPDLKGVIRHRLAPVIDSHPGDAENSFTAYRYWTRINFGERLRIARIEFVNVAREAGFHVVRATLFDSRSQHSMTLPHYDLNKWEPVYDRDNVLIVRNKTALPRCWLVAEAEAVDGEEALRRIRGESEHPFDPRTTALLEIQPAYLPQLPGGPVSAKATANLVSYDDNRLTIETSAETPTVLVVSEMVYPGWVATVDGVIVPIHITDFLLRGIALPAGSHRVEMRYTASAARNGAIISMLSLLLVGVLGVYARRSGKRVYDPRSKTE